MGKQVVAGLKKGLQLSRLERTPDKREVGGSSPLKPIGRYKERPCVFLENRIQKINLILNILQNLLIEIEVKTSEVTKQLTISFGYKQQAKDREICRENKVSYKCPSMQRYAYEG